MLKVNNKNTKMRSMTPFWCFYWQLGTYFTPFSGVSVVDFEQVNFSWLSLYLAETGVSEHLITFLSADGEYEYPFEQQRQQQHQDQQRLQANRPSPQVYEQPAPEPVKGKF